VIQNLISPGGDTRRPHHQLGEEADAQPLAAPGVSGGRCDALPVATTLGHVLSKAEGRAIAFDERLTAGRV
jgi:hypothetical protein